MELRSATGTFVLAL